MSPLEEASERGAGGRIFKQGVPPQLEDSPPRSHHFNSTCTWLGAGLCFAADGLQLTLGEPSLSLTLVSIVSEVGLVEDHKQTKV